MKEHEAQPNNPNQIEKQTLPSSQNVLGWNIDFIPNESPQKPSVNKKERHITISHAENDNPAASQLKGIFTAARQEALTQTFRTGNVRETLDLFSKNPAFVNDLMRLTSARILKDQDPETAKRLNTLLPKATTSVSEFRTACALFIATGSFPPATPEVKAELNKLPTSPKTNEHLLSALSGSSVTTNRKHDYYTRFLKPTLDRLRELDSDLQASQKEEFQPSTDDSGNEKLDEKDIMQRVEPFTGGYYREKVLDAVDWEQMKVKATGVPMKKLQPRDVEPSEEKAEESDSKIYTFSGKNGKKLSLNELSMPLPANTEVLPGTASGDIAIYQTINGTQTIQWLGQDIPPDDYQIQFIKTDQKPAWQKTKPTETEQGIPDNIIQTFSQDTRDFLNNLKKARITDKAKVLQIARRVQKKIEYVNDSEVGDGLKQAGTDYFKKLEELKKGDCDVSGFYALAQIRTLDIPSRMIMGYHIKKDKRFPFAAIAGDKHAWLEWHNKDSESWTRIDPTPPKPNSDEDENQEEESGSGGNDREMELVDEINQIEPDETDDEDWGLPFTDDELEQLKEKISEADETEGENLRSEQIFQTHYGISKERWNETRRLAEEIGRRRVPREATLDKKSDSTISNEWQHIFDLLLISYRIPSITRPIMGRQSQGGELADPVSAGVDIITGNDDPYGYAKRKEQERLSKLPIRFSNDFLLDITASMNAENDQGQSLLDLERQFVLSSLYEGFRLNERLKQQDANLRERPIFTHHILSIHGGAKWQELLKNEPMTLKNLTSIEDALKKPTSGTGAMADAIESYIKTLEEDQATLTALRENKMLKTLTILTDGNLWCSACGKESCNYQLHGPTINRVNKALEKARQLGIFINAIGFTEQSRPVTQLFSSPVDPDSAVVIEDLNGALIAHHRQITRAMQPILYPNQTSTKNL